MAVLGMQIRHAKEERFEHRMPRRSERLRNGLPGCGKGVEIGDDDGGALPELLAKDPGRGADDARADFQAARLVGGLEGFCERKGLWNFSHGNKESYIYTPARAPRRHRAGSQAKPSGIKA